MEENKNYLKQSTQIFKLLEEEKRMEKSVTFLAKVEKNCKQKIYKTVNFLEANCIPLG